MCTGSHMSQETSESFCLARCLHCSKDDWMKQLVFPNTTLMPGHSLVNIFSKKDCDPVLLVFSNAYDAWLSRHCVNQSKEMSFTCGKEKFHVFILYSYLTVNVQAKKYDSATIMPLLIVGWTVIPNYSLNFPQPKLFLIG